MKSKMYFLGPLYLSMGIDHVESRRVRLLMPWDITPGQGWFDFGVLMPWVPPDEPWRSDAQCRRRVAIGLWWGWWKKCAN